MNKKGFTLIELLAVLVILGVLTLLISPLVMQTMERFKKGSYENQVRVIEVAASDFATDYLTLIPLEDGQTIYITIGDLKEDGYLNRNLENPNTNDGIPNDALVAIKKVKNNYSITFDKESGTNSMNSDLSGNNAPKITLNGEKIMQISAGAGYIEPGYTGSVSGVVVTYKKDKTTVSVSELTKKGIYTIYYKLEKDGITQVVTRNVIVG